MNLERILVVDDDELVRTGVALDLKDAGYEVVTARSAEEALDYLESQSFELILSDLVMAEMDGLGLLHHARARWPDIGFIVITGHGTVGRALEAMQRGANDFIQKPADPSLIRQRVRTLLDDVRLHQALMEDRRKERQRREALQKRMIRDQRMVSLGRLAEGISTYLGHLLQPLLQSSRDLAESLPPDHPALQELKNIHYAHRKTEALIADLRVIGHGTHLTMESLQLDVLLRNTLASPDFSALKKFAATVHVQCQSPSDLPPVRGSEKALEAVILNLSSHAFEGMPDGGVLRLDLHVEQVNAEAFPMAQEDSGRYITLTVTDTSPYPPAQDMERLFEPFQPRRINDHMSSTGLSMSVVYRILQEHHGFMDVQTRPSSGNAYILYFPAAQATAPATAIEATLTGHETVLVLDDNPDHRQRAVSILERLGYDVVTAATGHEAVDLFRKARQQSGLKPIDLVLLDLVLGDAFDGLETYKEIVEIDPSAKAILVSGFAEFSRIVEARRLGLARYVQKPYRLETLGQAIRAELDRSI